MSGWRTLWTVLLALFTTKQTPVCRLSLPSFTPTVVNIVVNTHIFPSLPCTLRPLPTTVDTSLNTLSHNISQSLGVTIFVYLIVVSFMKCDGELKHWFNVKEAPPRVIQTAAATEAGWAWCHYISSVWFYRNTAARGKCSKFNQAYITTNKSPPACNFYEKAHSLIKARIAKRQSPNSTEAI